MSLNRLLTGSHPSISVVIPVYRSAKILPELLLRLHSALKEFVDDFEIILVNDGSPDNTWSVIEQLFEKYPATLISVDLLRNFGQHNATLCGIRLASKEIIVTMDDDLQHPPEQIQKLISALDTDTDLVYGSYKEAQFNLFRVITSYVSTRVIWILIGGKRGPKGTSFRAFPSKLRLAFSEYNSSFVSIEALLEWSTSKAKAIPIDHHIRKEGQSNYNLRRLWIHFMNTLVSFSTRPLFLVFLPALGCLLLGVILMTISIVDSKSISAQTLLTIGCISFFSGIQLFCMGIYGEYLARIYVRTLGKPCYCLSTILRSSKKD